MQPTTVRILLGAPVQGDEARFLRTLHTDLCGIDSLILANFIVGNRQVDFVVVTPDYSTLLELKCLDGPICGDVNGTWTLEDFAGNQVRYQGENPWQQTLQEKFALNDELHRYARRNSSVPRPIRSKFFHQFDAYVCVFPQIGPRSHVTPGDHRVAVCSYKEVLAALRTSRLPSSWSIEHWEEFAQNHLRLTPATVEEATDPHFNNASEIVRAYKTRLIAGLCESLAPLLQADRDQIVGSALLEKLREPSHFILEGPSGSAKTFHLQHLTRVLCETPEVPLFASAKAYQGGEFWQLLRFALAPFHRGDPKDFLAAVRMVGFRPALLLDGINDCKSQYQADLLRGVQAFALNHDARVIISGQASVPLPSGLRAESLQLALPQDAQRRTIYCYHAGIPATSEVDHLCSGFDNAYDLSIAGRLHAGSKTALTRTELYDRYTRHCVAGDHSAVMLGLLRSVAGEMAANSSVLITRHAYEAHAERYLSREGAPLCVLDELSKSRLLELTDNYVVFEHELLFRYFKAEHLARHSGSMQELSAELRRPRSHDLLSMMLPRCSSEEEARSLLASAADAGLLCDVLTGRCGEVAKEALLNQCEELFENAAADLPNVSIALEVVRTDNGRSRLTHVGIAGNRSWSRYDALLCHTIALNLGQTFLRTKFLDLLDMTEWALRASTLKAAQELRFNPEAVWAETVRLYSGGMCHVRLQLPCIAILSSIRDSIMFPGHYESGLPVRGDLLSRVFRNSGNHFAFLTLLEDLKKGRDPSPAIDDCLELVRQAWDTGVYILKVEGLEFLQSLTLRVHETSPEKLPEIREMLTSFDTDDISVNTLLLETMAGYEGFEPPVPASGALTQFRAVIEPGAAERSTTRELAGALEVSPQQLLADRAYGLISCIFEDVFQGAYFEAYFELSDDERRRLLLLAGTAREPGFSLTWVLRELLKFPHPENLGVYLRYASGLDGGNCCIQEVVASYVLSVLGCAQLIEHPPTRLNMGPEPPVQAWSLVGDILFWCFKASFGHEPSRAQIGPLWARIEGPVALACADVLYQISHCYWRADDSLPAVDLVHSSPLEARRVLLLCLERWTELPTLFQRGGSSDPSVILFIIRSLGRLGDPTSISHLQRLVDDETFGREALESIASIQKSSMRN